MPAQIDFNTVNKELLVPVSETVFMFSGQGLQYFHMGRTLY